MIGANRKSDMGNPNLTSRNLEWLAGFLEGEGSFGMVETQKRYWYPLIQVSTTDADVVSRAAGLFGTKLLGPWKQTGLRNDGSSCKLMYGARVRGANAAGWMMTLYSLLGERRRCKIRDVLARWRAMPSEPLRVWGHASKHKRKGG